MKHLLYPALLCGLLSACGDGDTVPGEHRFPTTETDETEEGQSGDPPASPPSK